jgi:hypothetical protein
MKLLRIFIVAILLLIYGYSTYRISINPTQVFWGYLCAIIFAVLSAIGVTYFANKPQKEEKKEE